MRLGQCFNNVDYMPKPNKVETYITNQYPTEDRTLIGGSWVFCFNSQGEILMSRLRIRGKDLPGGKVDPPERNADVSLDILGKKTAVRETYEETKVKTKNLKLIGWRSFHSDGKPPENPKFSFPLCYFLYYYAEIDQLDTFVEEPQPNGAVERLFLAEELARKEPMIEMHKFLYQEALDNFNGKI